MTLLRRTYCKPTANQILIFCNDCSFVNTTPEAIASPMRIVAVSATLPNISEIAEFLVANEAYVFDESFRPVPLTTHVVGMGNAGKNDYKFWSNLDREIPDLILRYSDNRPTIIFVHSKNDTEKLADMLSTHPGIASETEQHEMASKASKIKLQRVLLHSIAYHHAGLEIEDRRVVEQCFASGKIKVLCTTSTLAMGVNLPARLVIIKGTKAYRGKDEGYQDLDQASLLQMIGRAGRPGYDTTGTAVIMTESHSKAKFERMAASGLEAAKSRLMSTFDEILNVEISQNVVTDSETGLRWIQGTLYYTQVKHDPASHGIRVVSEHSIDTHTYGILRESFKKLAQVGAVGLIGGSELKPYDACHIMGQHLVDFATMTIFSNLPFDVSERDILKATCQIERLQRPVKRSEKNTLNAIHKHNVRFKLEGAISKVRIKEPWEKAFVLLQASIGRVKLEDYTLRNEASSMVEFASRMLAASEEYAARSRKNGRVAVQSLRLRRSLETSLWGENNGSVLAQFSDLNENILLNLRHHGIFTFQRVLDATENELERAAGRKSPFGSSLITAVKAVVAGQLKIGAKVIVSPETRIPEAVLCNLQSSQTEPERSQPCRAITYTLFAYTDRPNGCLLYRKNISAPEMIKFSCPPAFGKIKISLIASMIGLDGKFTLVPRKMDPDFFFITQNVISL
jgi:ATP-dependent DNA helicase HFM1/MER3